ncbi:MAG TPA: 5-deoxy-glucuronate isomerase [Candidatus Dormibacteraeota bacterium]|nr:5-deoxy-glucuronate isomerase [Candidatus Dormibacteraeota bacterium]
MSGRADDPASYPAAAPPNTLGAAELRLRPDASGGLSLEPGRAGWRYLGFRVVALGDEAPIVVGAPDHETGLVVIGGGGVTLEIDGASHVLAGRRSPFDGLPWAAYLPAGVRGTLRGRPLTAGEPVVVALATASRSGRPGATDAAFVIAPTAVRVELRGRGNASRQINHILRPDSPADRLELVEVLTPSGNWSSWPPHKHDRDAMPDEAVLEEVYYYRFRRPEAWGVQRLYRADGSRDCLWAVRQGELVIVPDGYHPFVAAHGDDAYYLNALAGDRRTMACSFDPDLDWVREAWSDMAPDPRLPLVPPAAEPLG